MSADCSLEHLISKGTKFMVFFWAVDLDVIHRETTEATDLTKTVKKEKLRAKQIGDYKGDIWIDYAFKEFHGRREKENPW